jgi:hypothetical protein
MFEMNFTFAIRDSREATVSCAMPAIIAVSLSILAREGC